MRAVVVKLGGFAFPAEPEPAALKRYASVFKRISAEGIKLVVVAGGGGLARKLIGAARLLGASEAVCDEVGIMATRANAVLLSIALGLPSPAKVPTSLSDLEEALTRRNAIVMGGLQPGQSTDAVAVLAAEVVGANLVVKATDVDGIYTADPGKHPGARRLERLSYDEALKLLSGMAARAGTYELLDPLAVRLARRSGVLIRVVDGREPENIYKAVRGADIGSLVGP